MTKSLEFDLHFVSISINRSHFGGFSYTAYVKSGGGKRTDYCSLIGLSLPADSGGTPLHPNIWFQLSYNMDLKIGFTLKI